MIKVLLKKTNPSIHGPLSNCFPSQKLIRAFVGTAAAEGGGKSHTTTDI